MGTGDSAKQGDPCGGNEDGFSDLNEGTRVVVKDGAGEVIGTGSLQLGTVGPVSDDWREVLRSDCVMRFTVRTTREADFYTIEVGERGGLTLAHQELVARQWSVEIVIRP